MTEEAKAQELEALKPAIAAELNGLQDRPPVLLELTAVEGWLLFTTVQLALRHPANNGPTSTGMRDFANRLLTRLRPGPALARLAELGWDAEYDVEDDDEEGEAEAEWQAREN